MVEKKIYLIRHCQAKGQEPSADLTNEGREKALELVHTLEKFSIDHIISSPYKRAVETIKPFSESKGIPITINHNLKERVLSEKPMEDWLEQLEKTFKEKGLSFPGGESSNDALTRIREVIDEIFENKQIHSVAVVSHGNILSLLINHYETTFGFAQWEQMKNPDIFVLEKVKDNIRVKRMEK